MVDNIRVSTPSADYFVEFSTQGLKGLGAAIQQWVSDERCFIVTDEKVGSLWGTQVASLLGNAGIRSEWVGLAEGEGNKTTTTWLQCVNKLIEMGLKRDDVVVALGGGVVGDITGFASATALRGVRWVQVPTTLLAMVDSSVGGKTGVNLAAGKNLLGAIHQPEHVFVTTEVLSTLSEREYLSGLGEVLKTALLSGPDFWAWLTKQALALKSRDEEAIREAVSRCVQFKAQIVAEDEREMGKRRLLNAGHTIGHALESALGFGTLLHGEAVGIGLLSECRWAVDAGLCQEETLPSQIQELLVSLGLPIVAPEVPLQKLLTAMKLDKKARAGMLYLPVPVRVGFFRIELVADDVVYELAEHLKS